MALSVMDERSVNMADLFEAVTDTFPHRSAVATSDGRRYTYSELDDRANRCAHLLGDIGVSHGDRVAVISHNRIEWLELILGCFKLGALFVNVNYRYTAAEINHVLDDSEPSVVVVEPDFADIAAASMPEMRHRPRVLVLDDAAGNKSSGHACFGALVSSADPTRRFAARSGDDEYLLYTGGTTGLPKGVVWTQHNLFYGALAGQWGTDQAAVVDTDEVVRRNNGSNVVVLAASPLMHGNGQWAVFRAWAAAGTAVLWTGRRFDAARLWDTVERFRATLMVVVGDAMTLPLLEELRRNPQRWDLTSLSHLGSGGAVLSARAKAKINSELPHVTVIDGYGVTEAGSIGTRTGVAAHELPRFDVRPGTTVLSEDLAEAPVGQPGMLAVCGPVATGYWRDPAKTAQVFRTDAAGTRWAIPGDFAIKNGDGSITLLGRGSLSINTGGEKVFPDEVETVLKAHPAVRDTLVVGTPDPVLGEAVAAVVAARPRTRIDLDSLQLHARQFLAGYKIPRSLVVVDEIRRSPAGKADYSWARDIVNAH